jgi:hypothetical protein
MLDRDRPGHPQRQAERQPHADLQDDPPESEVEHVADGNQRLAHLLNNGPGYTLTDFHGHRSRLPNGQLVSFTGSTSPDCHDCTAFGERDSDLNGLTSLYCAKPGKAGDGN